MRITNTGTRIGAELGQFRRSCPSSCREIDPSQSSMDPRKFAKRRCILSPWYPGRRYTTWRPSDVPTRSARLPTDLEGDGSGL